MKKLAVLLMTLLLLLAGSALAEDVTVSTAKELMDAVSPLKKSATITLDADVDFSGRADLLLSNTASKAVITVDLNGHTLLGARFVQGTFVLENGTLTQATLAPEGKNLSLTLESGMLSGMITVSDTASGKITLVNNGVIRDAVGLTHSGCKATFDWTNNGTVEAGIGLYIVDGYVNTKGKDTASGKITITNNGTITGTLAGAYIDNLHGTTVSLTGSGTTRGRCGLFLVCGTAKGTVTVDQDLRSCRDALQNDPGSVLENGTRTLDDLLMTYAAEAVYKASKQKDQEALGRAQDPNTGAISQEECYELIADYVTDADLFGTMNTIDLQESFGTALYLWNGTGGKQKTGLTLKGTLYGEDYLMRLPIDNNSGKFSISATAASGSPSGTVLLISNSVNESKLNDLLKKMKKTFFGKSFPSGVTALVLRVPGELHRPVNGKSYYLPTDFEIDPETLTSSSAKKAEATVTSSTLESMSALVALTGNLENMSFTLSNDFTCTRDDVIVAENLTLDGNGHSITGSSLISGTRRDVRALKAYTADGKLTLKNFAEISGLELEKYDSIVLEDLTVGPVYADDFGTFTASGVTFRGAELDAMLRLRCRGKSTAAVVSLASGVSAVSGRVQLDAYETHGVLLKNETALTDVQVDVHEKSKLEIDGTGSIDSLSVVLNDTKSPVTLGAADIGSVSIRVVPAVAQKEDLTAKEKQRATAYAIGCKKVSSLTVYLYDPTMSAGAKVKGAEGEALLESYLPGFSTENIGWASDASFTLVIYTETDAQDNGIEDSAVRVTIK